jgi:Squalene-hopene cyclase C-terminal domain
MNSMSLAILAIASSLAMLILSPASKTNKAFISTPHEKENVLWDDQAVTWLLEAQSPNGGWGAGSHAYQNVTDPHAVQTDPATTAFAALALLKSGGPLKSNPYQQQIEKALDRILKDIDARPDNGRITSLSGTQPQVKLGIHIDASMALQFLTDIREQINDPIQEKKIDEAAEICIQLIQGSQNADGGWAGGGWAPVLQSAMANNALERAQDRYDVDKKAIDNSRQYQANNISAEGVRAEDAAGVPLYAAASAQRATSAEAREMELLITPGQLAGFNSGKIKKDEIIRDLETKGVDRDKAERLTKSYAVNQSSTKTLQSDDIWNGFGNNGGEEYLSYMMTSEALAQQGKEEWLKWRQSIEPKFKQSQNPNGSWSGQHCITSPVFCTAAIIQAWNAGL